MTKTIYISVQKQELQLNTLHGPVKIFRISTAKLGTGQQKNSNQTPLGEHIIRAKIGTNVDKYTVFHGRRPLEYLWSTEVEKKQPETDWILTRILWLSGMEVGFNRLGKVDTMQRYIYIHGTNEENLLGTPSSHGCIRMSNDDVIHLYNEVEVVTKVFINEK